MSVTSYSLGSAFPFLTFVINYLILTAVFHVNLVSRVPPPLSSGDCFGRESGAKWHRFFTRRTSFL